jgi:hypothetical protein
LKSLIFKDRLFQQTLFNIAVYWKRKYRNKGSKEPRYRQLWIYGMELWADLALNLIALKPHKRLFFQRGFQGLSLMKQAF